MDQLADPLVNPLAAGRTRKTGSWRRSEPYDIYCAVVLKTGMQTLSIKDWNEQLKMASNLLDGEKVFTLKYKLQTSVTKRVGT